MSVRCAFAAAALVITTQSTMVVAQIDRQAPKFTPSIDGTITADEIAGQLEVEMSWPFDGGALVVGPEPTPEQLSAKWYLSWDDAHINFSAVVFDDTPDFHLPSGGAYNAQDVIQPCFNPFNDPDHFFNPDPGGGPAAIYDMVVDTVDEFGPDIYRHGALLTPEGYESITIDGMKNAEGYVLEASIPWSTAMDDVDSDYVPKIGDAHGLGLILLSFDGAGAPTLFTDYGDGINTIHDPTTWHKLTLVAARAAVVQGDFNGNNQLDAGDIDELSNAVLAGNHPAKYDVNADAKVNQDDRTVWISNLRKTWVGDSNLDGLFNSADLVSVFTVGQYEDTVAGNSTWATGDWNGDKEFNSSDFVAAFSAGGYEAGPVASQAAVPEPSSFMLVLIAVGLLSRHATLRGRQSSAG